jgi:ATP-dependent Clp protease ATP-binding subunit ClpA
MSLVPADARQSAALAQLAPSGQRALHAAAAEALRVHAREISLEHLVSTLMADEASAAHRAVLHAFADPDSIAAEALALAPGLLVVGSGASLPFSTRAARALFAARTSMSAAGARAVEPEHLARAAVDELDEAPRGLLASALDASAREASAAPAPDLARASDLLHAYSLASKRALGLACRLAHRARRRAIAPAHVLLACLEGAPELGAALGFTLVRARAALSGRDEDASAPPDRPLAPDAELGAALLALAPGADTHALLALAIEAGSPELRALLGRHRTTSALLERTRAALADPAALDGR